MKFAVTVRTDILGEPDEKGKPRVIKRNVVTREMIYTEDIRGVAEIYNNGGRVLKGYCRIRLDNCGELVVKHPFKQMQELMDAHKKRAVIKGFKSSTN